MSKIDVKTWLHKCIQQCRSLLWKHNKEMWGFCGILVVAVIVWGGLGNFGIVPIGDFPRVSKNEWQSVFLANNQVYFGHLENYNRAYVRVRDVYYLQVAQPLQQGGQQTANVNVVKLGSELHGPQDFMFIPKSQILFWENMKNDSPVVRAISSSQR